MPGTLNSRASGQYLFLHPVIVAGVIVPAVTMALQKMIVGNDKATMAGAAIDTTETLHPFTVSIPAAPGAIVGTTCGPARAVCGYSKKFLVNNKPTLQSGTKKLQNTGNCPISPMVNATSAKVYCFVSE